MTPKQALRWVSVWVSTALLIAAGLFYFKGAHIGAEFITCYIIEWTLSVDNLFVFLMIFHAFGVDSHRQLRALTWGIIGAIVMRMLFITFGVVLVSMFEPILYVFGAILIWSAYKMARQSETLVDVKRLFVVRWVQKRFRVTEDYIGDRFFVRRPDGALMATPMVLVVAAIESADVMFAIDSIPAAFAITRNPFIIFSANIMAILGLRSLYFLLVHADKMFRFLKYGVSFILAYVGVKMILAHYFKINPYLSLGIILTTLIVSILTSLIFKPRNSIPPRCGF